MWRKQKPTVIGSIEAQFDSCHTSTLSQILRPILRGARFVGLGQQPFEDLVFVFRNVEHRFEGRGLNTMSSAQPSKLSSGATKWKLHKDLISVLQIIGKEKHLVIR